MAQQKNRIAKIRKILKKTYPDVKTQLSYRNPFELLVATILSAQCTDKQVNFVTRDLFNRLKTPADFARAPIKMIEDLIRPTGYFRNKAKNIQNCAKMIVSEYSGYVPDTLEEMVKLPGVGRKTANVVLGAAFGTPGIVVDTHVGRISQRLELTANKDPVKIEFDLMKIIPRKEWSDFSLQLIYFGRAICKARKPSCSSPSSAVISPSTKRSQRPCERKLPRYAARSLTTRSSRAGSSSAPRREGSRSSCRRKSSREVSSPSHPKRQSRAASTTVGTLRSREAPWSAWTGARAPF